MGRGRLRRLVPRRLDAPRSTRRCPAPPPHVRALPLLLLAGLGCAVTADAGYLHDLASSGAATVDLRAGGGDTRASGPWMGLDLALRGDFAPDGKRFSVGPGALVGLYPGWEHDHTPYAHLCFMVVPARGGSFDRTGAIYPTLDLGVWFYPSQDSHDRSHGGLAFRVEWLDGPSARESLWMGLVLTLGGSHSFNCCK